MRFGLLTQWYDPEPGPAALPGVLARGLRDRGHEVQVLTGFPNYPTGAVGHGYRVSRRFDERLDSVDVRRVALYADHSASLARRIANYASFGVSATVSGLGALRGVDALWVNYSPITVAWPMWAAQLCFGVPAVLQVSDLWPDTVFAGGFAKDGRASGFAEKALHQWCKTMYASASDIVYISPGVGAVLEQRGVPAARLHYVPMWADEQIFHPSATNMRAELKIADDQVVLLYAGAIGEAQGLSTLIDACAKVDDARFICLIAGSGIAESSLRAQAQDRGVANVRFLGRLPREQMTSLMATADLCYVGLRSHALSPITMPSKTQALLAAGCPLLVAAEGDVARVVKDAGAGFAVDSEDVQGIADAITSACATGRAGLRGLGNSGRAYYERTFSVEQGVSRIEALLLHATTAKRRT